MANPLKSTLFVHINECPYKREKTRDTEQIQKVHITEKKNFLLAFLFVCKQKGRYAAKKVHITEKNHGFSKKKCR